MQRIYVDKHIICSKIFLTFVDTGIIYVNNFLWRYIQLCLLYADGAIWIVFLTEGYQ